LFLPMSSCESCAQHGPRLDAWLDRGSRMNAPIKLPTDEIRQLKACINDLVSTLALPAIWSGRDPSEIATTLLDAVVRMLRLDFGFLRLTGSTGDDAPIEVFQLARSEGSGVQVEVVRSILHERLSGEPQTSCFVIPNPAGEGSISAASLRLGIQEQLGVLLVGSVRVDFPTQTERLVLDVAANQAVVGLHEAQRLTEQKRLAEELDRRVAQRTKELVEREARIRRLVDANIVGIFIWDLEGRILEANDAFLRIVGYDREELVDGRIRWTDLTPPRWFDGDARAIQELKKTGTVQPYEKEYFRRDGSRVPVLLGAATFDESAQQGVAFVLDLTERQRAAAARVRLEERLRQAEKLEAIGRFASGIVHDFNNVLGAIFAYGELLVDETLENTRLKRYAQNVLTAATRGRDLVDKILTYTRSQLGKRRPTDVCCTVAEALELVRASLPASIRLHPIIPDVPLVIMGDDTQVHQIVMNLCSNGIHAMKSGGPLRVAITPLDVYAECALSHGILKAGSYARLSVEDCGCGMNEETLARIFEPFFTTKQVGRGTGLGLALVYGIVADFGGVIDVKSVPDSGSTFSVYIPIAHVPSDSLATV